jgi:hypothetical protein
MDERFKGKRLWIGLGALAIVGLCLMLFLGAMAAFAFQRHGSVHGMAPQVEQVQPPTTQEGGAVPQLPYGPGGWGMGRHRGLMPLRSLFLGVLCFLPLLFFGLIAVLAVGLARRRCWGRWSEAEEGPRGTRGPCGPGAWHHHGWHWGPPPGWGPPPEQPGDKPDTAAE